MISWMRFPYEVQLLIVVEAVNSPTTLSSVSILLNFFLLSRDVHDLLLGCPRRGIEPHYDLFLRLFESRFDVAAPRRRLVPTEGTLTTENFATAFKQRCRILRDIRNGRFMQLLSRGELHRVELELILWEVYLMLLEDDGKNMAQLEHAGIEVWLRTIMLSLLAHETGDDGWPLETTVLQLAAANFSMVSDRAGVFREGLSVNREIIDALEPILLGSHRYPHTSIPITCLYPEDIYDAPPPPTNSLLSMATMPIFEPSQFSYFGLRLTLSPPPLAPSAAVIITNRQEQVAIPYSDDLPANRMEADAHRIRGATKEEWTEMNKFREYAIGVQTPRAGGGFENLAGLVNPLLGSKRWDHAFNRMRAVAYNIRIGEGLDVTWFNTVYTPGMFTGFWLGRIVYPDARMIRRIFEMHPAPLAQVRSTLKDHEMGVYVNFFQANLREHVNTDSWVSCGEDELGNGVQNGYFPSAIDPTAGRNMFETGAEVIINDPREPTPEWAIKRYQTWHQGMTFPEYPVPSLQPADSPEEVPEDVEMAYTEEGIGIEVPHLDIVLSGETDYSHGMAFWPYKYYGRVRHLDGLIVLVRVLQNADLHSGHGRWVFSGNMQQADTIVGTYRDMGNDIHRPTAFQAPFIISKLGPYFNSPSLALGL